LSIFANFNMFKEIIRVSGSRHVRLGLGTDCLQSPTSMSGSCRKYASVVNKADVAF